MVVKSATKKKLMDRGMSEQLAHTLADDRKWSDVMDLNPREIAGIVDRSVNAAVIIWLKIGGLEVKFDESEDNRIFLFPKWMRSLETEPVFSYYFDTGVVTFEGDDNFRGLGTLFGNNSIFDWFTPHTSSREGPFTFVNVPEATDKQVAQLNSLLHMGVMENILNSIENKTYLTGAFRASINRQDIANFLISENPSLAAIDIEMNEEWDGLESLFG